MTPLTDIEQCAKRQTDKEFGTGLWGSYEVAREKLFLELLPYIRIKEPFLTDHGPEHIIDVLNKCYQLLGKNGCVGKDVETALAPVELYFLVLSCLFHDVGNIFGRTNHQNRLAEAYAFAKGSGNDLSDERQLLFRIVSAHGGKTPAGSTDTIGPLEHVHFRGKRVDLRRVAAVLRFADELAEGPQRTSHFMQQFIGVPADAAVYHDYAESTRLHIGREDERIVVNYHIDLIPKPGTSDFDHERLTNLLMFCYYRVIKLDNERRYNKHYTTLLHPFKRTEVSFAFSYQLDDHRVDLHVPLQKLVFDDLVLPDVPSLSQLTDKYPSYQVRAVLEQLEAALRDVRSKEVGQETTSVPNI